MNVKVPVVCLAYRRRLDEVGCFYTQRCFLLQACLPEMLSFEIIHKMAPSQKKVSHHCNVYKYVYLRI